MMRQPRIVDLRNIFNPEEMRGLGFVYEGLGRHRLPTPTVIDH
jgi:UDPglucose 6-dehydrogenase